MFCSKNNIHLISNKNIYNLIPKYLRVMTVYYFTYNTICLKYYLINKT